MLDWLDCLRVLYVPNALGALNADNHVYDTLWPRHNLILDSERANVYSTAEKYVLTYGRQGDVYVSYDLVPTRDFCTEPSGPLTQACNWYRFNLRSGLYYSGCWRITVTSE